MKKPATPDAPAAPPPPANAYEGQGGSYSFDPATGTTSLRERAGLEDAAPDTAPQTIATKE